MDENVKAGEAVTDMAIKDSLGLPGNEWSEAQG